MIVMKFGGTSVGDAKRIKQVSEIVTSQIKKKPIVIVSAFAGVTDALIKSSHATVRGNVSVKEIEKLHYSMLKDLNIDASLINEEINELKDILDGVYSLKELTPRTLDVIMSFGERMSAKIIASYMSKAGIPSKAYNSYDAGLITNSVFGDADALPEAEKAIYNSFKKMKNGVPIVTGFIGKTKNGEITTLGRGGSDYTASIIGAAVNAEEIQIWTDADGIMTADPKIVKDAKTIEYVSYDEAAELAFLGAKILHPKTILPAVKKNIPVRILNTYNPSGKGTTILKNVKKKNSITSIAYKKGVKIINVHSPKMFLAYGFMAKIFDIFSGMKIPVDMISTSEVNLSLTVNGKYDTRMLIEELKKIAEVKVYSNKVSISVVGNGIAQTPGIAGKIFDSIGENKINVEMISSGASEINVSFVVDDKDSDKAVRLLHEAFFGEKNE